VCAGFSANALPRQPASLTPIAGQASSAVPQFTFKTVDDAADPGFNRLLGINNEGRVVGYYGSGAAGHPNRGYIVYPPYGQTSFRHVDDPSAVDTQVTSLNNKHTLAGVYVDTFDNTFGFIEWHGLWFNYEEPQERDYKPVTELRALNDTGTAVGHRRELSPDPRRLHRVFFSALERDEGVGHNHLRSRRRLVRRPSRRHARLLRHRSGREESCVAVDRRPQLKGKDCRERHQHPRQPRRLLRRRQRKDARLPRYAQALKSLGPAGTIGGAGSSRAAASIVRQLI
jgi:hypothetical protein